MTMMMMTIIMIINCQGENLERAAGDQQENHGDEGEGETEDRAREEEGEGGGGCVRAGEIYDSMK